MKSFFRFLDAFYLLSAGFALGFAFQIGIHDGRWGYFWFNVVLTVLFWPTEEWGELWNSDRRV